MADASGAAAHAAAENEARCRAYIAVDGGRTSESDDESYNDGGSDGSTSARYTTMAGMTASSSDSGSGGLKSARYTTMAGMMASSSSGSDAGAVATHDRVVTLTQDVKKRSPGYFDQHTDEEREFYDVMEPSTTPHPVLGAARDGIATHVAALLSRGCCGWGRTWRRRGVMHLAARRGSVVTVATLMRYGIHANAGGDIYGHTPLHLAAQAGHQPVVRVLVEALLGVPNLFGDGPLHVAVRNGRTGVVSFLWACGASAVLSNNYAESPMTLAGPLSSVMGQTVAKRVMGHAHMSGRVLAHALVPATWCGRVGWVRALIHAGARHDVDVVEEEVSAIEAAVFGSDPTGIVDTLVPVGGCSVGPFPPLPKPDDRADAPLNALARRGRDKDLPTMTILLAAGADANYRDKVPLHHSFTPLENAAFVGRNAAMVKKLLEHQADVHAVGGLEQRTVLHWAAVGMRPEICGLLIDAGADVRKRDGAGHTPLQLAVRRRDSVRYRRRRRGQQHVSLSDADATLVVFRCTAADVEAGGGSGVCAT